jgi:hypothetical protein
VFLPLNTHAHRYTECAKAESSTGVPERLSAAAGATLVVMRVQTQQALCPLSETSSCAVTSTPTTTSKIRSHAFGGN